MAGHDKEMHAPGVLVLSLIFLAVFIIIWFAHVKWLSNVWGVQ